MVVGPSGATWSASPSRNRCVMVDTSNYPPRLAEIVDDFATITDRAERTEMLIEWADQFEPVPGEVAERPFPEDHKVPACESEAYVWVEDKPDGTLKYY